MDCYHIWNYAGFGRIRTCCKCSEVQAVDPHMYTWSKVPPQKLTVTPRQDNDAQNAALVAATTS